MNTRTDDVAVVAASSMVSLASAGRLTMIVAGAGTDASAYLTTDLGGLTGSPGGAAGAAAGAASTGAAGL